MRFRLLTLAAVCIAFNVPASAQTPAMDGLWRFDMTSPQGITTLGAMTVRANKDSGRYEGRLITNGGVEGLPIHSLEIQSGRMTMEVRSAHGPISFRGQLSPSGQSFSGTVRYHDGRDFSMAGVKQGPIAGAAPGAASR
jgi:hypothetical protein